MRISDWSSDVCSSDLGNFSSLADIVFRSFSGLGITAGGGGVSADDLLHPGAIAGTGFTAAHPLLDQVAEMSGFPEFFGNFLSIAVLLICWLLVVLAFFILAIQDRKSTRLNSSH